MVSNLALPGWAVFEREVRRFFAVPVQTIAGPIGSSLLYFIIFHFSIGKLAAETGQTQISHGINYVSFLIPGIMAMEVINASFQNPVSSLMISKWGGTIADQLMAPLSPLATWMAYIGGALVRALIVSFAAFMAGSLFSGVFTLNHPFLFLLAVTLTTAIFSGLGILAGVVCRSFDQIGMIGTFVIQPLVFLGGVFFSFQNLPESLKWLPFFNPIFYIVNMFRQSILGVGDAGILMSFSISALFAAGMGCAALVVLRRGIGMRT